MTRETALFSQAASQAAPEGSSTPSDRATSFQPVEGGGEHRSGVTLMVEAYAVIWTILMVWLVLLWRKQARLNERLDGLEGAIVKASRPAQTPLDPDASAAPKKAAAGKLGDQTS
jgi:CcmD family protein